MKRLGIGRGFALVILIIGVAIFMLPMYVMVAMSLKTPLQISNTSIWSWPDPITWKNYQEVLANPNVSFGLFFRNTTFVSVMCTLGTLASSVLAAYAFARLQFRGKDRLFLILLATMMLPGITCWPPNFLMPRRLPMVSRPFEDEPPDFLCAIPNTPNEPLLL